MAAWSQILQIVGNSTLFYLSFDIHDSPEAVFIWKSKFSIGFGNVGKIWVKSPCVQPLIFMDYRARNRSKRFEFDLIVKKIWTP